jgi:squalene-hopene/tetraprenyl-beta-curcumene cyclase
LPELPSDIDDLSQIVQVLARCGRSSDLASFAEPSLSVVLRDNLRPDGAIRTWILPSVGATPTEERQALFVRKAWGDGSDTEVIANFLYGLWVYDRERFLPLIDRGARFVLQQQNSQGAWPSTWYDGPFYGTYVCVRLLAEIGIDEPLERARSFLLARRQTDGGWGSGANSDQLSTALALCTLRTIAARCAGREDDNPNQAAIAMLCDTVGAGRWDSPVFIRMNVGRAKGKVGPWLKYGSSAVTAAYLLKVAAAYTRR